MLRIIIRKTTCLCVFLLLMDGVCGDEVKSVCVTEGDSVTLKADVTGIESKDQILWTFGPNETRIAEIYKQDIDMFNSNEIFGDRLQMDSQTGSLTITNIRFKHTGVYKLEMRRTSGKSHKTFNVTVYAPLPVPVITSNSSECPSSSSSSESRCLVVCSAGNVSHVTLSWHTGHSLLSSISVSDLSLSLSLPLEVEYEDKNAYSCVLNNPITNHTTHLDNSRLCHTCAGHNNKRFYGALIPAVLLAMLAIVMYCLRKRKRSRTKDSPHEGEAVQTDLAEVDYAETTFVPNVQHKKPKGTEETIYSTVTH